MRTCTIFCAAGTKQYVETFSITSCWPAGTVIGAPEFLVPSGRLIWTRRCHGVTALSFTVITGIAAPSVLAIVTLPDTAVVPTATVGTGDAVVFTTCTSRGGAWDCAAAITGARDAVIVTRAPAPIRRVRRTLMALMTSSFAT